MTEDGSHFMLFVGLHTRLPFHTMYVIMTLNVGIRCEQVK